MRALVVDDSRPIRRIEGEILKELGFETVDACHGRQALERLQSGPLPDVVLVDWNMPEMDGLEFIVAVRSDDRYVGLPILMVTTETEPEQRFGCNCFPRSRPSARSTNRPPPPERV